jgi:hypothetical protein
MLVSPLSGEVNPPLKGEASHTSQFCAQSDETEKNLWEHESISQGCLKKSPQTY